MLLCAAFLCNSFLATAGVKPAITPIPSKVTMQSGHFTLSNKTTLFIDTPATDKELLGDYLSASSLALKPTNKAAKKQQVVLKQVEELKGMQSPEAYILHIGPQLITIQATSGAGLFYGTQTLLQLAGQYGEQLPTMQIEDEPRFDYRGSMLDVSRHFFDKEFVKKQIRILSYYKINRLHLHLTDDAGWRIEIKKYPRLTQFAGWRQGANWKDWNKGGNKYLEEGTEGAYGGYYTQEDIRELVDYATKHYVTIIPEIEMPAHSGEVLAAYPELSCAKEPYKQADFCIGNEQTFEFLQDVLTEVMDLFPSVDIHIGGDEAGKGAWKKCEQCQARMKAENLADVDELQSYMIHRIEVFLNSKGRNLLGWDEILEGGLAPNATVMSWRGTEGGIKAAQSGHRVIMTPGQYCYLDGYQDAPDSQPEAIGGYLPLKKVYGYDPIEPIFTPEQAKQIYGVQGNLWCEYVPTPEHAEYMLYPRMVAIAEVGWSQQENRSWEDFKPRALAIVGEMREKGYSTFALENEIGNRPEAEEAIDHLGRGKSVKYNAPLWGNYPAAGEKTLTDGLRGGWNYNDQLWQGFVSKNRVDVVIDLEKSTDVKSIAADFMQICGPEVFMPKQVIISISEDGENFTELANIEHTVIRDSAVTFKNFGWEGAAKGRYVRYQAFASEEFGGVQFIDEIVIK
ncbi:MAG: glycoside hydrolase family 20 protein [Phocaeicola sp.]